MSQTCYNIGLLHLMIGRGLITVSPCCSPTVVYGSSKYLSVFNVVVSDLADPGRDCRPVDLGGARQCFRKVSPLLDLSLGSARNQTTAVHRHLDPRTTGLSHLLSSLQLTFTFWRDERSSLTKGALLLKVCTEMRINESFSQC